MRFWIALVALALIASVLTLAVGRRRHGGHRAQRGGASGSARGDGDGHSSAGRAGWGWGWSDLGDEWGDEGGIGGD